MKTAAVYLGSKDGNSPIFCKQAYNLGFALAKNNIKVVYGGTNIGTMNALANGVLDGNGQIVGVIPKNFRSGKIRKENIEFVEVENLQQRKATMEQMSDYAIILPGAYGTFDELFECAVNKQLGYKNTKIIIFNLNGFYNPLIQMFCNMEENGFLTVPHTEFYTYCVSVNQIIKEIVNS